MMTDFPASNFLQIEADSQFARIDYNGSRTNGPRLSSRLHHSEIELNVQRIDALVEALESVRPLVAQFEVARSAALLAQEQERFQRAKDQAELSIVQAQMVVDQRKVSHLALIDRLGLFVPAPEGNKE